MKNEEKIAIMLDWYNSKFDKLKDIELGLQIEWEVVKLVHSSRNIGKDVKR